MPRSKPPRRRGGNRDWAAVARRDAAAATPTAPVRSGSARLGAERVVRRGGKAGYLVGGAAAIGTAGYLAHRYRKQKVVKMFDPFSGREVTFAKTTTMQRYVYDGRFLNKDNKEHTKHAYKEYGRRIPSHVGVGAAAGGAAGALIGRSRLSAGAGAALGSYAGLMTAQNKGRKSAQRRMDDAGITKSRFPVALPVPGSTKIAPRLQSGKHVSHANKLVVAHGRTKNPCCGVLVVRKANVAKYDRGGIGYAGHNVRGMNLLRSN